MINSFCIETPVPVSGSAQGHLETARPKADVAYCHGKLLCPEELMLYSTTGEKLCSDDTEFMGPSPFGRGWRDGRKADAPGEGRKSSQICKPSPHPLPGGRVIPPVADPNLTTQTKSLGTYRA